MDLPKRRITSIEQGKEKKFSLDVVGHSRASEATYFYLPQLKMKFDCGAQNKKYDDMFQDHCINLMMCQKAGYDSNQNVGELIVPFEIKDQVLNYIRVFQELNDFENISKEKYLERCKKDYDLKAVKPGDRWSILKNKFEVLVVDCCHGVPCRGYAILEKRKKLKSEYSNLPGKEIGKLRKTGVEVTSEIILPRILFLGDTTIDVFKKNEDVLKMGFSFVFVECTFLGDKDLEIASKKGHIHWKELREYVEMYPSTLFVLTHFSLKYSKNFIEEYFKMEGVKNVLPWLD